MPLTWKAVSLSRIGFLLSNDRPEGYFDFEYNFYSNAVSKFEYLYIILRTQKSLN
jgi:hypothetical protein